MLALMTVLIAVLIGSADGGADGKGNDGRQQFPVYTEAVLFRLAKIAFRKVHCASDAPLKSL